MRDILVCGVISLVAYNIGYADATSDIRNTRKKSVISLNKKNRGKLTLHRHNSFSSLL